MPDGIPSCSFFRAHIDWEMTISGVCKLYSERGYIANTFPYLEDLPETQRRKTWSEDRHSGGPDAARYHCGSEQQYTGSAGERRLCKR